LGSPTKKSCHSRTLTGDADHRAAGQVVLDAVFPTAGSPLFFPELLAEGFNPHTPKEVWRSLTNQPNTSVDVTETWGEK